MDREFYFDERSQRYRVLTGAGKGSFISREAIKATVERNLARTTEQYIWPLNRSLQNGEITLGQWEEQMRIIMKRSFIQSYLVGSPLRISQRDYGIIGSKLRQQYAYLRQFTQQIALGKVTIAEFENRSGRYVQKAKGAFERGVQESYQKEGYTWERRVLDPSVKNCEACIQYASEGWQPIGSLPEPTESCDCYDNCHCIKEFK